MLGWGLKASGLAGPEVDASRPNLQVQTPNPPVETSRSSCLPAALRQPRQGHLCVAVQALAHTLSTLAPAALWPRPPGLTPPHPPPGPPLQGKPVIKDMQASVDPFCVTATFTIHNKPVNAFWALFKVGCALDLVAHPTPAPGQRAFGLALALAAAGSTCQQLACT